MIVIKSIRLLHLISYVLVTSQVLFYLFILCEALKAVSLENYFEQRKVIDSLMGRTIQGYVLFMHCAKHRGGYCIGRTPGFSFFHLLCVRFNSPVS